eukprot:624690-Pelagomonas_calceolata.AAC.1
MRRMADSPPSEGVSAIAYKKSISARPKDLVSGACAEVCLVGTFKFKRVGEPFSGDHAPFTQG